MTDKAKEQHPFHEIRQAWRELQQARANIDRTWAAIEYMQENYDPRQLCLDFDKPQKSKR